MKIGLMGMSLAIAAGGTLVITVEPAQAAANCAVGSWEVTRYAGEVSGDPPTPISGLRRTELKISKTAIVWNFDRSTDQMAGSWDDDVPPIMTTYRKTLKMRARVTGTERGSITADPSSATGNAIFSTHAPGALPKVNLVKGARTGLDRNLYGGSYTCKAKTLKISGRHTYKNGEYDTWIWWLHRAQ